MSRKLIWLDPQATKAEVELATFLSTVIDPVDEWRRFGLTQDWKWLAAPPAEARDE